MLETHTCIGFWDPSDKIILEACKQSPYVAWRQLAMGLGVPPHQVRIKQTFIGAGNSGGKQEALPMDFASVMLSKKTGKPVSMGRMNPQDRRIVHITLKQEPGVRTLSKGDGFIRQILIVPKKPPARRRNNHRD